MAFGVVQHGFLSIVGGAKRDFETTLRVCLYAGGVRFWEVIPLVNWIGRPWVLTVQSIGRANAHETAGGKGAVGQRDPFAAAADLPHVLDGERVAVDLDHEPVPWPLSCGGDGPPASS